MLFELFPSSLFNIIFGIALVVIVGHAVLKMTRISADENPMDSFLKNFVVGLFFLGIIYWILKNKIIEIPTTSISGTEVVAFVLIAIVVIPLLVLLYGLVVVLSTFIYEMLVSIKNVIMKK